MLSKDEVRKYIALAQNDDKNAKDILIENNLGLVHSVLKRYKNSHYEYDDLFQIGCIGLIKAIYGFDLNRDNAFSTYAVLMIIGEIKRHFRDDGSIKISRSIKELSLKCMWAKERLEQKLGRAPTINEIAQAVDQDPADVSVAVSSYMPLVSLDNTLGDDDEGREFSEMIGADCSELSIEKIALKEAIGNLEKKDRTLIYLRYYKGQTQTQTAKVLGMTQVQVSRSEKKIIQKLKDTLTG